MYAIFRALGKQFRAEKGKTIRLPLMDAEAGAKVTFDEVLLSSDGETIKAGTPLVSGAKVVAEVVGVGGVQGPQGVGRLRPGVERGVREPVVQLVPDARPRDGRGDGGRRGEGRVHRLLRPHPPARRQGDRRRGADRLSRRRPTPGGL